VWPRARKPGRRASARPRFRRLRVGTIVLTHRRGPNQGITFRQALDAARTDRAAGSMLGSHERGRGDSGTATPPANGHRVCRSEDDGSRPARPGIPVTAKPRSVRAPPPASFDPEPSSSVCRAQSLAGGVDGARLRACSPCRQRESRTARGTGGDGPVRGEEVVGRWSTSSLRHVLCCKPSSHSMAAALPCPPLPRQPPSPPLGVPPRVRPRITRP
jgi:hypothetical protein